MWIIYWVKLCLGKDTALRPTENTKSSESSTPISCEEKSIVSTETFSTFHEPDVIASTKVSNNGVVNVETDRPIAPPRRRRRKLTNVSIENDGAKTKTNFNVCKLPLIVLFCTN